MENKEIREFSQVVKLDHNSKQIVSQYATYDPNEKWLVITHDGNEISLSLDNWEKLKELADKAVK